VVSFFWSLGLSGNLPLGGPLFPLEVRRGRSQTFNPPSINEPTGHELPFLSSSCEIWPLYPPPFTPFIYRRKYPFFKVFFVRLFRSAFTYRAFVVSPPLPVFEQFLTMCTRIPFCGPSACPPPCPPSLTCSSYLFPKSIFTAGPQANVSQ